MTTTQTPAPLRLGFSELRTIHGAGGIVRDTLEQIEEWRSAADGLRLLDAAVIEQTPAQDAPAALADILVDAVTSGQPVPEDIADTAHRMATSAETGTALAQAFTNARAALTEQMDNAVRRNWGTLLGALNDELQDVVASARALGNLPDLRTAETALAADRGEDYRTWRSLVDRNTQVRMTQMTLLRKAGVTAGTSFPELAFIQRPETLYEHWRAWHAHGHLIDPSTGAKRLLRPPWPTTDNGLVTAGTAGSEEFMRWALAAGADLWVPTPTELDEETTRLNKVLRPDAVRSMSTEHREAAPPSFVDPSSVPGTRKAGAR